MALLITGLLILLIVIVVVEVFDNSIRPHRSAKLAVIVAMGVGLVLTITGIIQSLTI